MGLLRQQFPVLARMQPIARASASHFEEVNAIAASSAAGHTARPQAMSERITVALIPAAADHLRRLQQRTNLSKTDIANRAITSYEFLDAQFQAGHELIIRDGRTGKTEVVRFL